MHPITIPSISLERTITLCFSIILGLLFVGYAGYQARNLIQGPHIDLEGELATIQTERAVSIVGTARNVVMLRLNGREIHTNEQGRFTHTLTLENGYTIVTLEAVDRYGRTTEIIRPFIYKPTT